MSDDRSRGPASAPRVRGWGETPLGSAIGATGGVPDADDEPPIHFAANPPWPTDPIVAYETFLSAWAEQEARELQARKFAALTLVFSSIERPTFWAGELAHFRSAMPRFAQFAADHPKHAPVLSVEIFGILTALHDPTRLINAALLVDHDIYRELCGTLDDRAPQTTSGCWVFVSRPRGHKEPLRTATRVRVKWKHDPATQVLLVAAHQMSETSLGQRSATAVARVLVADGRGYRDSDVAHLARVLDERLRTTDERFRTAAKCWLWNFRLDWNAGARDPRWVRFGASWSSPRPPGL